MLHNSKLIGETDKHYQIELPSGHKMELKKDGLHEKAHVLIQKMKGNQSFPDGGMVAPVQPIASEMPPIESELDYFKRLNQPQQSAPIEQSADNELAVNAGVKENVPSAIPEKTPNQMMASGYEDLKKAQSEIGAAKAAEGYQTAKAIGQTEAEVASLPSALDVMKNYEQRDEQLMNAYKDNKINPDRFWADKSTGQKIAAGIGMLLGGFGSVAGQGNMAADMIQKSIDRDIEAQKNDQSNAMNLWKMNREKMGNDMQATLATKNQMYTALKYKIDKAAANSYSQVAKAEALKANSLIDGQIALQRAKMAALSPTQESVGGAPINSEQAYVNHINYAQQFAPEMAKEYQEKYIPGVGVARIKPTDKDREQLATTKNVIDDLTELQALATQGMTLPGTKASEVNKNKIASTQLKMKNAFQLGVLSQSDLDMLDKLVVDPGSFYTDKAMKKLQSTKDSMNGILNSTKQKLGVTPFKQQTTSNKINVTNGKESYMIDAADLAAAQKDGFHVQ